MDTKLHECSIEVSDLIWVQTEEVQVHGERRFVSEAIQFDKRNEFLREVGVGR